ncbi:MAG: hypothetical protein ACT4TC_13780 [Myxococcaceae bacterium]
MMMLFVLILGVVFGLATLTCSLLVIAHAWQRSVGTGVMVMLVPFFILYYAFAQFENRYKGPIVATMMCGLLLGALPVALLAAG